MMKKKSVHEEELYYGFTLEDKVPENHLLRKIKEAVDFSFVYDLVEDRYSHTGAPSIDPVVVFKLSLIGYLYNIPSERRIIQDVSLHMAYLWFIDYKITEDLPDHSIFTKARNRFGEDVYKEFFDHVVKMCDAAGLIQGDTAYMDATIIDAKPPLETLRSRPLVERLKDGAKKYVDELDWDKDDDEDKNTGASKQRPLSKKARVNRSLASSADADAQVITMNNQKPRLAYKGHIAVDGGEARIVTACDLTGGAYPEEHLLWQLAVEHELITDRKLKYISADTKYSTSENYRFLKAKGIIPAIPRRKGGVKTKGGYSKDNFTYNQDENTFTCPQGKPLHPAKPVTHWKTYRSKKADCNRCQTRHLCLAGQAKRRTIMVSRAQPILDWAVKLAHSPIAKELLRKRKIWPETIFANAKSFHGLSRTRFKGRWRVKIQALLTFTAINLKKLVKFKGKKRAIPALSINRRLSSNYPSISFSVSLQIICFG